MGDLNFRIGQYMEAKSNVKGYRGAWFRSVLMDISHRRGELWCALKYVDFPDEKVSHTKVYQLDPTGKKRQVLMLRPAYPPICQEESLSASYNRTVVIMPNSTWHAGDLVDWWHDNCFWLGRVKDVLDKDLVKDCSSGACERNWSSYSLIHTKIRNRLKTTQLEKLVYCRANLRLIRKLKTLAGPMQIELLKSPLGEGGTYEAATKDLRPTLEWSVERQWVIPQSKAGQAVVASFFLHTPHLQFDGDYTRVPGQLPLCKEFIKDTGPTQMAARWKKPGSSVNNRLKDEPPHKSYVTDTVVPSIACVEGSNYDPETRRDWKAMHHHPVFQGYANTMDIEHSSKATSSFMASHTNFPPTQANPDLVLARDKKTVDLVCLQTMTPTIDCLQKQYHKSVDEASANNNVSSSWCSELREGDGSGRLLLPAITNWGGGGGENVSAAVDVFADKASPNSFEALDLQWLANEQSLNVLERVTIGLQTEKDGEFSEQEVENLSEFDGKNACALAQSASLDTSDQSSQGVVKEEKKGIPLEFDSVQVEDEQVGASVIALEELVSRVVWLRGALQVGLKELCRQRKKRKWAVCQGEGEHGGGGNGLEGNECASRARQEEVEIKEVREETDSHF